MKPRYSVIIPTRNEEESIAKVLCSIPEKIKKNSEVIVVDSSKDLTPEIAEKLGARVIKVKKGKGRAMRKGAEHSKGTILVFLDGDCTDPPEFIPKLLRKLRDSDLVLGCRTMKSFKADDKFTRNFFIIYNFLIPRLFYPIGLKVPDPLAGFRAIRKKDWNRLELKSNGFEIEAEMDIKAVKLGFKIRSTPIPYLKRGGGLFKSKLLTNPKMVWRILSVVLKHVKDEKLKAKIKNLTNQFKKQMGSLGFEPRS